MIFEVSMTNDNSQDQSVSDTGQMLLYKRTIEAPAGGYFTVPEKQDNANNLMIPWTLSGK